MVEHDETVRKSNGDIVQFKYGADGFDAIHLVRIYLDGLNMLFCDFSKQYLEHSWESYLLSIDPNDTTRREWEIECSRESENLKILHEILQKSKRSLLYKFADEVANLSNMPVNICEEMYALTHLKGHVGFLTKTNMSIHHLNDRIQQTVYKLREMNNNEPNHNTEYYVRSNLCCKEIIVKRRWTMEMLDELLLIILRRFRVAKIQPNEMVGALAAESFGEPCTQMTLNTFVFLLTLILYNKLLICIYHLKIFFCSGSIQLDKELGWLQAEFPE